MCIAEESDEVLHGQRQEEQDQADMDVMAIALFLLLYAYAYFTTKQFTVKRVVIGPCKHLGLTFTEISSVYDDRGFRRAYRMTRGTFQRLLDLVRKDLEPNKEMGWRSGRLAVDADMRLGLTLRLLAGAFYLDVQVSFKIGCSTVYDVFRSTCKALMTHLSLPGLPSTEEEFNKSELMFRQSRPFLNPLSGCVGALDGICVKIKKPKAWEKPASFYCRKGYYALPVQALCDSSYRFLSYSGRCVGSTHDAHAHAVSNLGQYLQRFGLPSSYWIVGDEAYVCDETLVTPYPSSQAGKDERNFNYFLSVMRVHIEQAFGQLVARWRILLGGLEYSLSRNARIVCLCMQLHNFCIDNDEKQYIPHLSGATQASEIEESALWYQESKEL